MELEIIILSPFNLYHVTPWNTPWAKENESELLPNIPDWYPFSNDLQNEKYFGLTKDLLTIILLVILQMKKQVLMLNYNINLLSR